MLGEDGGMTDLRHRVAQEIWNASYVYQELTLSTEPAQPELFLDAADAALADSLDAAWAEAEAALPDGWAILGLDHTAMMDQRWRAEAQSRIGPVVAWNRVRTVSAEGLTPAAALRALAAKLREVA